MDVALPAVVTASLAATGAVTPAPTTQPGVWSLTPGTKIGAVAVGEHVLRIQPKIDVRRVIFLLGYALNPRGWQHDDVPLAHADDLLSAVAQAYALQVERALRPGVLHGYRTRDDALTVLRGRMRSTDQLQRRFALPLPLEVRYSEFTADTTENRTLKAAALRLLEMPVLPPATRGALRRVAFSWLADVAAVPARGLGKWHPSRLNSRYQPALALADIVLAGQSFEHARGPLPVTGFLLDMATLFEDFVTVALRHALTRHGGAVRPQYRTYFDQACAVPARPDLVWLHGNTPAAVVDAKWKAETAGGRVPNADLYQMLAYCTVLSLPRGHLVYARGNEAPAEHQVRNSHARITCHAVDLEQEPAALLAQIRELADELASVDVDAQPARSGRLVVL